MLMPEAAMYQNGFTQARKHQIGCAGQVSAVKPEAEAHRMRGTADAQLRQGVDLADAAHLSASFLGRQTVRHSKAKQVPLRP